MTEDITLWLGGSASSGRVSVIVCLLSTRHAGASPDGFARARPIGVILVSHWPPTGSCSPHVQHWAAGCCAAVVVAATARGRGRASLESLGVRALWRGRALARASGPAGRCRTRVCAADGRASVCFAWRGCRSARSSGRCRAVGARPGIIQVGICQCRFRCVPLVARG